MIEVIWVMDVLNVIKLSCIVCCVIWIYIHKRSAKILLQKWELENILSKGPPVSFQRCPNWTVDAAILEESTTIIHRFCSLSCSTAAKTLPVQVDAVSHSSSYPRLKLAFHHGCWYRSKITGATGSHTDSCTRISLRPTPPPLPQLSFLLNVWFTSRSFC